uniref:Uncharacterized protein n=1 Tax=Arundo donax TaxID=35708 RepID=A0A0A9G3Q6_ARUDO
MFIGRKLKHLKRVFNFCNGCLSDANCFHDNSFTYGLVLAFVCIFRMV